MRKVIDLKSPSLKSQFMNFANAQHALISKAILKEANDNSLS